MAVATRSADSCAGVPPPQATTRTHHKMMGLLLGWVIKPIIAGVLWIMVTSGHRRVWGCMNGNTTCQFLFNEFGFVSWFLFPVAEKSGRNDAVAR